MLNDAAQRQHELAAGFDRQVMEKQSYDVGRIYVDQGKHLYLTATRKGTVQLGEPIHVRLGWPQFLQLIGHTVMGLCGMGGITTPSMGKPT